MPRCCIVDERYVQFYVYVIAPPSSRGLPPVVHFLHLTSYMHVVERYIVWLTFICSALVLRTSHAVGALNCLHSTTTM